MELKEFKINKINRLVRQAHQAPNLKAIRNHKDRTIQNYLN